MTRKLIEPMSAATLCSTWQSCDRRICKTFSRQPMPARLIGNDETVRSIGMIEKKSIKPTWLLPRNALATQKNVRKVERCATSETPKAHESREPMSRVKMIGDGEFDQFFATGNFLRQSDGKD